MLKLKIEGQWEPSDFIEVFGAVESMYYKVSRYGDRAYDEYRRALDPAWYFHFGLGYSFELGSERTLDELNSRIVSISRRVAPSKNRIFVRRIQYSSPGGIDLLGLGKAFEIVKNSIGSMIRYFDERHLRQERDSQATLETERSKIGLEMDKENLRSLQIRNAREALRLREDYTLENDVMVALFVRDQELLADKIMEQKLVDALTERTEE